MVLRAMPVAREIEPRRRERDELVDCRSDLSAIRRRRREHLLPEISRRLHGWRKVAVGRCGGAIAIPLCFGGHESDADEIEVGRSQISAARSSADRASVPIGVIQSGVRSDHGDIGVILFGTRKFLRPGGKGR